MIRSDDFDITIGETSGGTFIHIVHIPTGNQRRRDAVGDVGRTRDSLLAELRGLLFSPEDIRCDTGRGDGGDVISVRHLPSGIQRTAMRRDSSHELLLDEVLTELWADRILSSGDMNEPNTYWQSVVDALRDHGYRFRIRSSGDDVMTAWQPWVICPSPGFLETRGLGPVPVREVDWLDVSLIDSDGTDQSENITRILTAIGATFSTTVDSIQVAPHAV